MADLKTVSTGFLTDDPTKKYTSSIASQTQNGTVQNGGVNSNNNQLYYSSLAQNNGSGASSLATAQTIQNPTATATSTTPTYSSTATASNDARFALPTRTTSTLDNPVSTYKPAQQTAPTTQAPAALTSEQKQLKDSLLSQYYTVGNAQNRTNAAAQLKAKGWSDDLVSYLKSLVQTGTDQQRANAIGELKSYWGIDMDYMPKSYDQLMTTDQINKYAYNQANQQFENEKLGYDQAIERYKQQQAQLQTDAAIKQAAQQQGDLKYADQFVGLENQMTGAKADYDTSMNDINNSYTQALQQLTDLAKEQKGNNLSDASRRGLGNSSILSQTNSIVDTNKMKGTQEAATQHENNIFALDTQINALVQGIRNSYTSLTKQQQSEVVAKIDELTKARDDQKSQLQTLIDQQYQSINNSRNNIVTNQNQLYNQLYGENSDRYRTDRSYQQQLAEWKAQQDQIARENAQWQQQFAENQRQFNANLEMEKKKLAAEQAAAAARKAESAAKAKAAAGSTYSGNTSSTPSGGGGGGNDIKNVTQSSVSAAQKMKVGLSSAVNDATYYKYVQTMSQPAAWTQVKTGTAAMRAKEAARKKVAPTYNNLLNAALGKKK